MWDHSSAGKFYREINPTVSYKLKFHIIPRAKDVQITRLRLGHVTLKKTLHTIGQATDPNCESCGVPEDIEHFPQFVGDKVSSNRNYDRNQDITSCNSV